MSSDDFQSDGRPDLGASLDVREPRRFKVLLHNDDYTTMEFVVDILRTVFRKTSEQAMTITTAVHEKGLGVCGVYTEEVAETKVAQVVETARRHQHPLQCTMEKD